MMWIIMCVLEKMIEFYNKKIKKFLNNWNIQTIIKMNKLLNFNIKIIKEMNLLTLKNGWDMINKINLFHIH